MSEKNICYADRFQKQLRPVSLVPPAGGMKFLLDFFPKKSRVQGRVLPPTAQVRVQGRALPLPA
ncbi:hypothetical protein D3Z52_08975 [Clostridiaceae bacterium]|nr:hypothetical protein [Clostridiaceae bacterium]